MFKLKKNCHSVRLLASSIKNVSYIFDTNLFSLWREIKGFVPGISEGSFLKSLEQFSKQNG